MFTIENKLNEMPVADNPKRKSDEYEKAFERLINKGDSFFIPKVKSATVASRFHNYCKTKYGISKTKKLYAVKEESDASGENGVRFFIVKHPRDAVSTPSQIAT